MKKLLVICSLLVISACATPEQIAENKRLQQEADYNTCASYGIRPHTDMFAYCLMQVDLTRKQASYRTDTYYYPPAYIYSPRRY